MKYWIVPCNDRIFSIGDAIKAQGGLVDWRTDRFSVGDIVFIYKTKPEQCIRYKMEVQKVRINHEQVLDQEAYWADKGLYYSGFVTYYARLKLLEEYQDDILSLHHLHEHGYQGDPQSVKECKDNALLDFLLHPHQMVNEDVYDVDYPADDEHLYEGALVKVMANKYERNQKARMECVAKKGYQCMVCGRDFEATYGDTGKGFIHVHHLTPISSIGKEYELNVDEDLVPVCPNCHYMLHRKDPPYTIQELKDIMQEVEEKTALKKTVASTSRRLKKAENVRLIVPGTLLEDINDDEDVKRLILSMMEMEGGAMMKNIVSICQKQFQEKYFSMKGNQWRHIIDDFVREVTGEQVLTEETIVHYISKVS